MTPVRVSMAQCLIFLTILSLGARPGHAQSQPSDLEALKQDLEIVKKDLEEIKKALSEMRQLLGQRPAPPAQPAQAIVKVNVGGGPGLGKPDAPVTVVEFSDYECPFCQRHFANTLPALKKDYIDTGKVRYVFRDYPLDSIHPQARKAAEAAHCAGEQGKYWEMHDRLFKNQRALMVDNLRGFARDLGLKVEDFNSCLDQGKYATTVSEDLAAGSAVGVTGTPTFFIGKTAADGTIEATSVRGAQPITTFRQVVDRLLEGQKP
ncbi:MAG TPA: DsbA family protein [Anaerolineales bacterium]|nr:DsbA family protein [Anaerolineales bacterium]